MLFTVPTKITDKGNYYYETKKNEKDNKFLQLIKLSPYSVKRSLS